MLQDADANNSLDQNLPQGINNSHRESARPNDYMNSQASLQHCISSYHVYFLYFSLIYFYTLSIICYGIVGASVIRFN